MEEGPCLGHRARCGEREGERRAAGAGEEEEGGQEAAVACVRPSVLEGEPRCEAAHTHTARTLTRPGRAGGSGGAPGNVCLGRGGR